MLFQQGHSSPPIKENCGSAKSLQLLSIKTSKSVECASWIHISPAWELLGHIRGVRVCVCVSFKGATAELNSEDHSLKVNK